MCRVVVELHGAQLSETEDLRAGRIVDLDYRGWGEMWNLVADEQRGDSGSRVGQVTVRVDESQVSLAVIESVALSMKDLSRITVSLNMSGAIF